MSAVLFKEDIKTEKEIIQSSDALRTRKGMRVGAMETDATSGLGISDFPGWLVFVAQGREPNLGSRRIHGEPAGEPWLLPPTPSALLIQWRVDSRHVLGTLGFYHIPSSPTIAPDIILMMAKV